MNRRQFFSRLFGGAAATVGGIVAAKSLVHAPDDPWETRCVSLDYIEKVATYDSRRRSEWAVVDHDQNKAFYTWMHDEGVKLGARRVNGHPA